MEKLEMLRQKLSKKRKLAVGATLGGIVLGAGLGKVAQGFAYEGLKQLNLIRYKDILHDDLMFVILDLEQKYVIKYGLSIPHNPDTYLQDLQANRAVYGENFKYVYDVYETGFRHAKEGVMYINDVAGQSQAIGLGAGVVSFLLVAGIPTARYLMCKRKVKKLEKEISLNQEAELTA